MADQIFANRQECVDRLKTSLVLDPGSAVGEGLLNGFADACEDKRGLGGIFDLKMGQWVIKDEDLNLWSTVKDIITPMAAVGYVLSSLTAAGITGVALALIDLLRRARQSGAWLTPPHSAIVAILKKHARPLSTSEIVGELPTTNPPWTEPMVREALEGLQHIVTKKGEVALTQRTSDEKWFLAGV